MSIVMEKTKEALERMGINTTPDDDPNKLFILFDYEDTRFALMWSYSEQAKIMFISSDIPVEIGAGKEKEAFMASAYINQMLNIGSATYLADISRIVFKFYINMDEEEESLNLSMFFYCYYEAIDLVERFYPIIDLLEKGAISPEDVVEMERAEHAM